MFWKLIELLIGLGGELVMQLAEGTGAQLIPVDSEHSALFQLINESTQGLGPGAAGLLGAAMVGLGLAAGVTLGEFLAAPLRRGTRHRDSPVTWRRRVVAAVPSDS